MSTLLDALKQAEKEKQQTAETPTDETQQPDTAAMEKLELNIADIPTSDDDKAVENAATQQAPTQPLKEDMTPQPQTDESIPLSLHITEENEKSNDSETGAPNLLSETSSVSEPDALKTSHITLNNEVGEPKITTSLSSDADSHTKTSTPISVDIEPAPENNTPDNTTTATDTTQPAQSTDPHAHETAVTQETAQLLTTAATAPSAHARHRSLIFGTAIVTTALLASGAILSYSYFYAQTLQQNQVPTSNIAPIGTLAETTSPTDTPIQKTSSLTAKPDKQEEKTTHPLATTPITAAIPPKTHSPITTVTKATKTTQRTKQPHKKGAPTDNILVKLSFTQRTRSLIQKGQYHQAQTLLESNQAQLLRNRQLQALYIWALSQQNKWYKARFHAEKFYENASDDLRLARLLAMIYDHFDDIDQLQLLAQQHPSDPVVIYYAANRILQKNNTGTAAALLDKALRAPTPAPDLLYLRAYIHAIVGERDSALVLLKQSLQHIKSANLVSQRDIITLYQHIMAK